MQDLKLKLNANTFNFCGQELSRLVQGDKEYELIVREWDDKRSLSANGQQQVWYQQIADFYGVTKKEAEKMSKRDFGLPILLGMAEHGPKVDYTLKNIRFWDMTLDQQASVMDILAMTSLFKTKQHNLYRDQLQKHWEQLGLMLEYRK